MPSADLAAQPIRVLHVTHNMSIGGAEVVIKQLVSSIDTDRFEHQIVCIDGIVGELGQTLADTGLKVHGLNREPGLDFSLIRQLRALIKREQISVLHCHQYTPFTYGALASIALGINVVFTEHGRLYPDTWSWKRRLVNKALQLQANHIVAISEATREALVEYEWIGRGRIGIVYNGIDGYSPAPKNESLLKTLGLSPTDCILGTVSRLDSIKNQALMISALARVIPENPNARLLLVGDGPEREALEAQIEQLGLQGKVVISGYVQDVPNYLNLVDVFLLTSFSEGTSMALLEAMSMKKPVIATKVGGNIELLEHESSGLLIDSDDEAALASSYVQLLSNPELRARLGQAASESFQRKFHVSMMSSAYEELYDKK